MYAQLAVPFLVHALVLFVPGTLILRCLRFDWIWAACLSPLATIGYYCLIGQVYATLGIAANVWLMMLPAIICCVLAYHFLVRNNECIDLPKMAWWLPLLYITVGLGLGVTLFLTRLTRAEIFLQAYDVTEHLNLTRALADSGHFSSLGTSFYLEARDAAINPYPGTYFYPASWHILCALVVQATGADVPVVINASEYLFGCVVWPLSVLALLQFTCPDKREVVVAGSVACMSFINFPWVLFIYGPIYPNFAGFSSILGIVTVFAMLLSDDKTPLERGILGGTFVLFGIGLGLLHPAAIFTAGVLLVPCGVYRIWKLTAQKREGIIIPSVVAGAFLLACCAFWYFCFKHPAFHDIVWHNWPKYTQTWQGLFNIITLAYTYQYWYEFTAQLLLGLCVIIGGVYALHTPGRQWLAVSYLLTCIIMFFCATREGNLRQLLTGFWYSDALRVAAMCVLAAAPLAALGLGWFYTVILDFVDRYNRQRERTTHAPKIATACLLLFLLLNFLPESEMPGSRYELVLNDKYKAAKPLDQWHGASEIKVRSLTRTYHSFHTPFGDYRAAFDAKMSEARVISPNEDIFIRRLSEYVPQDAVVINDPMDGSFLTYGLKNVRCYYRNFIDHGFEETRESMLIRTNLDHITTNAAVRDAVKKIGAEYVIIMSHKGSASSFINLRGDYSKTYACGIRDITPYTEGFELIFRQGDMYLYRITAE